MASESDLKLARKAVAGFDWRFSPYRELAILLGHSASIKKTELYAGDFSGREFASGKLLGYLECLEDILALPAQLRAELGLNPPHEETRQPRLRSARPRKR